MEDIITIYEGNIEELEKINANIPEFESDYITKSISERIEDKKSVILIASIDKMPASYMISYDRYGDKSIYCWMSATDPSYRRRGLLKALMDYQINWSKKRGYGKIRIKTRNNRREMLMYLIKYGFNLIDIEKSEKIEDYRIQLEKNI
mgnify:CR=1 FL=1